MHSILSNRLVRGAMLLVVTAISTATSQDNSTREVTLIEAADATSRPAMVYRRVAGNDRDLIALSPTATADDLSSALRVLAVLQARFGATPERDMAAAARSERLPTGGDANAETRRQEHGQIISALRRSDRRTVAGFGAVRALILKLPRPSGQGN